MSRLPIARLIAFAASAAILCWVAVWNRFPILPGDTGPYIALSDVSDADVRRPSLYPAFIAASSVQSSVWFTAICQAFMAVSVLWLLANALHAGQRQSAAVPLAAIGLLSLLTSIPWVAVRIHPDIFVGVSGLAACLLLVAAGTLVARSWLAFLIAFGAAVHIATGPIVLMTVAAFTVVRCFRKHPRTGDIRRIALVVAMTALGMAALFVHSARFHPDAPAGSSWPFFMLTRLINDGVIGRLLNDHCGDRRYAYCAMKDQLLASRDFGLARGLHSIDGNAQLAREDARRMIFDAARDQPAEFLHSALSSFVRQAVMVDIRQGLQPAPARRAEKSLAQVLPDDAARLASSRQYLGDVRSASVLTAFANRLCQVVLAVSGIVVLFVLFPRSTGGNEDDESRAAVMRTMAWLVVGLYLSNAFVMSFLNAPYDRYQARIAWIVPAFAFCYLLASRARRRFIATPSVKVENQA